MKKLCRECGKELVQEIGLGFIVGLVFGITSIALFLAIIYSINKNL